MDPDKQALKVSEARLKHWKFGPGRCEYALEIVFEDGTLITLVASVPAGPDDSMRGLQSAALARAAAVLSAAGILGSGGLARALSPDWSVPGGGP